MNDKVKDFVVEKITDWSTGSAEFRGNWNEWSADYEMKYIDNEKLPKGISRNVSAETPTSVNALASTMTSIQIGQGEFELKAKHTGVDEQKMFDMEGRVREELVETEFERYLTKGNRSLFCFGSQIFEKPMIKKMGFEGTALRPLSLLQVAFNTECYQMDDSEHMSPVVEITTDNLRILTYAKRDLLNLDLVEKAIKEKSGKSGSPEAAKGSIDERRARAGYPSVDKNKHELILYSGRVTKEITEMPEFAEMWEKFGMMGEDPLLKDVTIWILDRKYVLGWYPTPYGSWKYLYCIGHDIEFELEPFAYGVGAFCHNLQKDNNRLLRYGFDTAKFNVFSMFFAGKGSGLKSNYMNIVPFSAIPCDDITQIKNITPNVDGIGHMMKLLEFNSNEIRRVSNATASLQATPTGVTATENNLLMDAALRAIKGCARINNTSVVRSYYQTLMRNLIDQNPYDSNLVDVDMVPIMPGDREFGTQEVEMLLKFGLEMLSIRTQAPIDFNPMPIFQRIGRKLGIAPREFNQPRPQVDRMLDVLRRLNPGGQPNEVQGEIAAAGRPDGNIPSAVGAVPASPLGAMR